MEANATGRVLRAFGPPEAEEVLDNVFTVGDVETIDGNDTVPFSRKANR